MKKYSLKQKNIAESARRIIITQGMHNLTIRELARELKLTEGAIYRHFRSKKEILELLIEEIKITLLEAIDTASKDKNGAVEKLKSVFDSHLSYVEKRKGVSFSIINETINIKDKSLQKQMLDVIGQYLNKIEEILRQGMRSGQFRKDMDEASASIMFFGMVQSVVTLWSLENFEFSLKKKYLDNLFDIYMTGIKGGVK